MDYTKLILENLLPPLSIGLGIVIPVVATWLSTYLARRWGLEIKSRNIEVSAALALDAAAYAYQISRRADPPLTNEQIMQQALHYYSSQAVAFKLKQKPEVEQQKLIEAALGKLRKGLLGTPTISADNVVVSVPPSAM